MEDCSICYQIKCRQCGWIPTDEEVCLIQEQKLTACPDCGWIPGTPIAEAIL